MANFKADNYTGQRYHGPFGNVAMAHASFADLSTATLAAADTIDFFKLPAGAKLLFGFMTTTAMTGTSTIAVGVKYSDGTSTGGTTGTAVLVLSTASAVTGAARFDFRFKPFTNDADTIIYATKASGPAEAAGDNLEVVLFYEDTGTK